MTDRLDEIKVRREAATPGPWKLWNGWGPLKDSEPELMACERVGPDYFGPGGIAPGGDAVDIYAPRADFEFIAHAPEDIDYLLGENARKDSALTQARTNIENLYDFIKEMFEEAEGGDVPAWVAKDRQVDIAALNQTKEKP
jgi:hypothetical protein